MVKLVEPLIVSVPVRASVTLFVPEVRTNVINRLPRALGRTQVIGEEVESTR